MNNAPDNLAIYDDNWESWLDMRTHGPASRWLRALIGDACKKVSGPIALVHDVGCGEGTLTVALGQQFSDAKVLGSDFSHAAIQCALRHPATPNVAFTHDGSNVWTRQKADLVCAFEVIEHIEDWQPFLAALADSASRYLLLSTPTGRMRPFERNMGHMRNFRPGELESTLDKLGFEAVHVAYAGWPFYSPLYRDACQVTNAGSAQFTRGRYSASKRFVCACVYALFRFGSTQYRGGDQFVGLFRRRDS